MEYTDKILLTAFCGTSSEMLLKQASSFQTMLLPNDKVRDSELVIDAISNGNFRYIFCFGQKPLIKDKIFIETTARNGQSCLQTAFDCTAAKNCFEEIGFCARLSNNAGTSFCNKLYYTVLEYLMQSGSDAECVFIHIPFIENITDANSFFAGITQLLKLVALP